MHTGPEVAVGPRGVSVGIEVGGGFEGVISTAAVFVACGGRLMTGVAVDTGELVVRFCGYYHSIFGRHSGPKVTPEERKQTYTRYNQP